MQTDGVFSKSLQQESFPAGARLHSREHVPAGLEFCGRKLQMTVQQKCETRRGIEELHASLTGTKALNARLTWPLLFCAPQTTSFDQGLVIEVDAAATLLEPEQMFEKQREAEDIYVVMDV